jgi:hypothetical protein
VLTFLRAPPSSVSALAYQHIARAMLHQLTLLLGRFDLHETHGRPPDRLADRLGIGGIVLVALRTALTPKNKCLAAMRKSRPPPNATNSRPPRNPYPEE